MKIIPLPEYNGYNTRICRERGMNPAPKSSVRYHPLINGRPAHHDTVNTALRQAMNITRDANQDYVVITADLQIYKIIVDIIFYQPKLLTSIVSILGHMHFLMDFVEAVGTLCAGSGLTDILKSTFGSVEKMLEGKKYPQNVRALRMLSEELLRPILLSQTDVQSMTDLYNLLDDISQQSKTSQMWVDVVIKPTLLMMLFLRADHEGDFALHITVANMKLPYFFCW